MNIDYDEQGDIAQGQGDIAQGQGDFATDLEAPIGLEEIMEADEDEDIYVDFGDGTSSENVAAEELTFDDLGLPADVAASVKQVGYETPSPIQARTIPALMEGRDVVGLAATGTGKTAAFALPILANLDRHSRTPQALILAPTRELALQVADAFQEFADNLPGISILPIYGGQAYGIQLSGLRRGAQVIVGTPGRIIDHLEKGSLDISELEYLVLDEADEMLNMGFQDDVERILEDTPDDKQVALFSATMPPAIRRISQDYLDDPVEVKVQSATRTNTNITQRYLSVAHRNKLDALTRILEVTEFDGMIIFVRTKYETEELAEKLRGRGFSAQAINGDLVQAQRERTVEQIKDGRLDILVATDVAARGLDVERVSHVLNYDIPHDTESYIHRIGRTGRAGRSGEAILFVTPRERRMLRSIEKVTNATIEEMELPTVEEVNESRRMKFADSITTALEDSQLETFKKLVREYSEAHDTPMEDIAAALATRAESGDEFYMTEREERRERRVREDRRSQQGDGDRRRRDGESRGKRDDLAVYRLDVGRRQNVRPGAIVGAIANEGGLSSRDFGRIEIHGDHTFVELPKDLSEEVFDRLEDTRISGQLINMVRDDNAIISEERRGGRGGGGRSGYRGRDGHRGRGGRDQRHHDNGGRDWYDRGYRSGGGRDRRGGYRGHRDRDRY
ncbi:MAG: DEAD/DEAH box helicase [Corynebacterium sp.]|nr:DEAD/DEAH box helicase [Corynebacterium sp.]